MTLTEVEPGCRVRYAIQRGMSGEFELEFEGAPTEPELELGFALVEAPRGLAFIIALALGWVLERDLLPQVDQGAFDLRLEMAEGTAIETTARVAISRMPGS